MSLKEPRHYGLRYNNFVSKSNSGRLINRRLATLVTRGRTDSKVFPSCNVNDRAPRAAYSLFSTSLQIICGTRDPYTALVSVWSRLRQLRIATESTLIPYNYRCSNIVASEGKGWGVNQDLFHDDNQGKSTWQPRTFVGLQFRPKGKKPVAIVFGSGMVVYTGCTTPDEPHRMAAELDLSPYRKGHEYRELPADKYAVRAPPKKRKERVRETKKKKKKRKKTTTTNVGSKKRVRLL